MVCALLANKCDEEEDEERKKQKRLMSLYQLEYNKNESAILCTKKDWFTIYIYWKKKKQSSKQRFDWEALKWNGI